MANVYNITFDVYLTDSDPIIDKKAKVYNQQNEIYAKRNLKEQIRKKYPSLQRLEIKSCLMEQNSKDIKEMQRTFKDLFGNSTPFDGWGGCN